jgi:glutathione synthase/RimK-type ligase-like ATP-grasp enzyme
MATKVLILSSRRDPHAVAVAQQLHQLGVDPIFWSAKNFFERSSLRFELNNQSTSCTVVGAEAMTNDRESKTVNLEQFDAIWLRRPEQIESPVMPEEWMSSFVAHESNRALDAIYRMAPGFWINSPVSESNARYKLVQLNVAKECGLSIPETLVTNDAEAARAFCSGKEEIIYKLIDERSGFAFPKDPGSTGIGTMSVRQADFSHLDQVKNCIHLFQRRIHKKYDVRATIVGGKVFSAAIESQSGKGALDFRLDFSSPMRLEELPSEVSDACLKLMRKLGLIFGAIDLAVDVDGRYQFFEVNPAGQWLWIEEALDLPISKALAHSLATVNAT